MNGWKLRGGRFGIAIFEMWWIHSHFKYSGRDGLLFSKNNVLWIQALGASLSKSISSFFSKSKLLWLPTPKFLVQEKYQFKERTRYTGNKIIQKKKKKAVCASCNTPVDHRRCPGPLCSISPSFPPGSLWCFPLTGHFLPTCSETSSRSALYLLVLLEGPTERSSGREPFNSLDYLTILTSWGFLDSVFSCYKFLMKYYMSFKSLRKIMLICIHTCI